MGEAREVPLGASGIVLAGGASRRLGRPKALLRFGAETLVERVVGIVAAVCDDVVVVSGPHLRLPPLPGARIVDDEVPLQGPLAGLRYGLVAARRDACFACSCDLPLLRPEVARRVLAALEGADAAMPRFAGHLQPLVAAYHRRLLPTIESMLAGGERSLVALAERVTVRQLGEGEIAGADPTGLSFFDVDGEEAYARALDLAGLA
jgi:molybdopterin-guanine dinucleotide biosynthesis protein A